MGIQRITALRKNAGVDLRLLLYCSAILCTYLVIASHYCGWNIWSPINYYSSLYGGHFTIGDKISSDGDCNEQLSEDATYLVTAAVSYFIFASFRCSSVRFKTLSISSTPITLLYIGAVGGVACQSTSPFTPFLTQPVVAAFCGVGVLLLLIVVLIISIAKSRQKTSSIETSTLAQNADTEERVISSIQRPLPQPQEISEEAAPKDSEGRKISSILRPLPQPGEISKEAAPKEVHVEAKSGRRPSAYAYYEIPEKNINYAMERKKDAYEYDYKNGRAGTGFANKVIDDDIKGRTVSLPAKTSDTRISNAYLVMRSTPHINTARNSSGIYEDNNRRLSLVAKKQEDTDYMMPDIVKQQRQSRANIDVQGGRKQTTSLPISRYAYEY